MYYKDGSIIKGEWKDGSVFGFAIETDCTVLLII